MSLIIKHNFIVAIVSPSTYLIFSIVMFFKNRALKVGSNTALTKSEKYTFIQVFIISFLNTSVAGLYVLMDYLTKVPQWIFTTAGIGWLAIHGFPPLIYLTLNKTIREDTRHAFKIIYKRFKIIIGVNNNDNLVHPALVNNYIGHHVDI
uniref:Uncharacterized protein n=2 Tax=Meloidogyne enterolobii TaxID=390850 RepID=A0A6V7TRK6_MELEN|nr:unnamed protein product [Meloidogyne enterolobii]